LSALGTIQVNDATRLKMLVFLSFVRAEWAATVPTM
jgi:hypothetical protein